MMTQIKSRKDFKRLMKARQDMQHQRRMTEVDYTTGTAKSTQDFIDTLDSHGDKFRRQKLERIVSKNLPDLEAKQKPYLHLSLFEKFVKLSRIPKLGIHLRSGDDGGLRALMDWVKTFNLAKKEEYEAFYFDSLKDEDKANGLRKKRWTIE